MLQECRGLRPRSGRLESSPALQRWERKKEEKTEPAKRATESWVSLSPASRAEDSEGSQFPSDKSLGYFQSSAARTISNWLPFRALAKMSGFLRL